MQKNVYEFISKKTNDPIIERRTCSVSGEEFAVFQSDKEFYEKISPTFGWKKFQIPFPTLCPKERQRRRLAQRNERNYYTSVCAYSGERIITNNDPKNWSSVYSTNVWWSDVRDWLDYGVEIQESSFFRQFMDLKNVVPKIALMNDNDISSENCKYTYDILYCKDCYMTMEAISDKVAHYCMNVHRSEYILDSTMLYDSQYCIECTDSYNLFSCIYTQNSRACTHMLFTSDCVWCNFCIWCVGLENKEYYLFNEFVWKELYEQYRKDILSELIFWSTKFTSTRKNFLKKHKKQTLQHINTEHAYGENILNSSEIVCGFELSNCQKLKYVYNVLDAHNCQDIDVATNIDHCLESVTPDLSSNILFSIFCSSCHWVVYSEMCHRCTHCFWCVWLKDKQYCILNVQYTKEEYDKKVSQVITSMIENGEWWEFFPISTSAYPYNLSDAMQWFSLDEEECIQKWYKRSNEDIIINIPEHAEIIEWATMESNVDTISDTICNKTIICETSWRPFRIIESELSICRKLWFPLPRKHPDIRHQERLWRKLWRMIYLEKDHQWEDMLVSYSKKTNMVDS